MQRLYTLAWRMWFQVQVYASSREEAMEKARNTRPSYVPKNTELMFVEVK